MTSIMMQTYIALAFCALILAVSAAPPLKERRAFSISDLSKLSNQEEGDKDWTDYVQFVSGLMGFVGENGDVFNKRDEAGLEKRASSEWEDWMIFVAGMLEYIADNEELFSKRMLMVEPLSKSMQEENTETSEQVTDKKKQLSRHVIDVISRGIQKSTRASDDDNNKDDWTDYMTKVSQLLGMVALSGNMFSRDMVEKQRVARDAEGTQVSDETLDEYLKYILDHPELYQGIFKRFKDASLSDATGMGEVRETVQDDQQAEQVDIATRLTMGWADYLLMIAGILRMIATGGSIFDG